MKCGPFVFQQSGEDIFVFIAVGFIQLVHEGWQQTELLVDFCDLFLGIIAQVVVAGFFLEQRPLLWDALACFFQMVFRAFCCHLVEQYARHSEADFFQRALHFLQGGRGFYLFAVNGS